MISGPILIVVAIILLILLLAARIIVWPPFLIAIIGTLVQLRFGVPEFVVEITMGILLVAYLVSKDFSKFWEARTSDNDSV